MGHRLGSVAPVALSRGWTAVCPSRHFGHPVKEIEDSATRSVASRGTDTASTIPPMRWAAACPVSHQPPRPGRATSRCTTVASATPSRR